MAEHLYLLINPFVPSLVKFGFTTRDPDSRAAELSGSTGVPGKWIVHHDWEVQNAFSLEQKVFRELSRYRRTGEFFELDQDNAVGMIDALLIEWGAIQKHSLTPAGQRELLKKEKALAAENARVAKATEKENERAAHQRAVDAVADRDWGKFIRPYCDAIESAEKLRADNSFFSRLGRSVFKEDSVTHLLNHKNFAALVNLTKDILETGRVARAWRLKLAMNFGDRPWPSGRGLQMPDGNNLPDFDIRSADDPVLEVRIAVQSAFGTMGNEATEIMQKRATYFADVIKFARDNPPPERTIGRSWSTYR